LSKVVVPPSAMDFIKHEIPYSLRSNLVPLIQNGYTLVNESIANSSFLNWEIGLDHLGYLKPIAIEFLIKNSIDNGKLKLNYKIASNSISSHRHLELFTQNSIITISQVQTANSIARHAYFRKKLQRANQLYFDFDEIHKKEFIKDQPLHLLITHGYQGITPNFINLGLPSSDGKWIDRINLLAEPRLVNNEDTPTEEIKEDKLVSFKKYVQGVHSQ
jgi:hypothetical protein